MFQKFACRLGASLLMFATPILVAPPALAQGVMVNSALLMDDDLLTMLDTDASGLLSKGEYAFFRDRVFDQNDASHNGEISADEYAQHASAVFADMDADRDGFLGRDEIDEGHMDMLRMMYKNPHPAGLGAVANAMLARMDTSHDGKVSAQEYTDAMKARFDAMDTNQDGVVSRKEFQAVHRLHEAEAANP